MLTATHTQSVSVSVSVIVSQSVSQCGSESVIPSHLAVSRSVSQSVSHLVSRSIISQSARVRQSVTRAVSPSVILSLTHSVSVSQSVCQSLSPYHSFSQSVSQSDIPNRSLFSNVAFCRLSKDPMQPKQLQIIRVQSLVRDGYKYVSKHWIWSDLFLLTSELLAHKSCLHWVEVQSEDVQFHNKGEC